MFQSLFTGRVDSLKNDRLRTLIVSLIVSQQDRDILAAALGGQEFDLHFPESFEETNTLANQLLAPVVLIDRDWPGTEWRLIVECLAALPHRPSVVLISSVFDDYLWKELVRWGGYDVLPKPLHPEVSVRVVKLALTFWNSAPKSTLPIRRPLE